MMIRRGYRSVTVYLGRWRLVRYDASWWPAPDVQVYGEWGWSVSWLAFEVCRVSANLDRDTRLTFAEIDAERLAQGKAP